MTDEQRMIKSAAAELAQGFEEEYWIEKSRGNEYPREFYDELVKNGWIGIAIPEEYGGGGMGMLEMVLGMVEFGNQGADVGLMFVLTPVFGGLSVLKHGSEQQKEELLPKIANGDMRFCFGITEPDAGSNALKTTTTAGKRGDNYVINGKKTLISGIDLAQKMLVVTRTMPYDPKHKVAGITLFLVDVDSPGIDTSELDVGLSLLEKQYEVFFDDVEVPAENMLGEEHRGLIPLFDTLNPERMTGASNGVGFANFAINKAVEYAKMRQVFDVPIGSHQGIQFPLADSRAKIDAVELLLYKAAYLYDKGMPCGREANTAKYLASEFGFEAVDRAVQTMGGYGLTEEAGLMRVWKNIRLIKTAPVTNQLVLAYIGQHVLGMPKSY